MITYAITFPDNSIYVGATKHNAKLRLSNHISKAKSGKYLRPLYFKMREFNYQCKYTELTKHNNLEDMYESEKGYIALFSGSKLLNNSSGGSISSTGKKVSKPTLERLRSNKSVGYFKAYCLRTKKMVYYGNSITECAEKLSCSHSIISCGLKQKKRKPSSHRKFIFNKITGGGLSQ